MPPCDDIEHRLLTLGPLRLRHIVVDGSIEAAEKLFATLLAAAFDEQGISLALAMTESFLKGKGACRVQGGGFAGTIEAYIPCDMTGSYFRHMEKLFGEGCCTVLAIRNLPTTRVK